MKKKSKVTKEVIKGTIRPVKGNKIVNFFKRLFKRK